MALCDPRIAARLAVGNGLELVPDAKLEIGPHRVERQLEIAQASCEIGAQLGEGFGQEGILRVAPAALGDIKTLAALTLRLARAG